jgi:TRAP-type C4-dicarboxylate transport system substrate-binding protein
MGASPTVVQVPEVPQMFATGAMHAMVTSSATGSATKAWEYVKNYYKTNAWNPKNVVVVNERAFGRLPKAQQDALVKAAADAEPRGWDMSKTRERDADELLAKNGITVSEPSAELKAALAKIGEQMAAEWEKSAGAEGQAILKAYRGK